MSFSRPKLLRRSAQALIVTIAVASFAMIGAPASAAAESPTSVDPSRALVYRNGQFRQLGTVPGAESHTHFAINNRGESAGTYVDAGAVVGPDGFYPLDAIHGFAEDRHGTVTTFDVPGGVQALPQGMNNTGDVVGAYIDAGTTLEPDGTLPPNTVHGFVRDRRGNISTFDVPFPYLHAVRDINDRGQMVGNYDDPARYLRFGGGFLREPNGEIKKIDIPRAGNFTVPFGINNRGQIVGWYGDAGTTLNRDGSVPPNRVHGFIWDDGNVTTLDVPGSILTHAYSINAHGQITGVYYDTEGIPHGYLYDDGQYTTIDAPGRAYTSAASINDRGDVLVSEPGLGGYLAVAKM